MAVTESGTYPPVVVPEAAGTVLVSFWRDGDEPAGVTRYPVLAWIVTVQAQGDRAYTDPVICEALPDDPWCLEQRAGGEVSWIFPEDRSFASFDEARAYATETIAREHQRRQTARPKALA